MGLKFKGSKGQKIKESIKGFKRIKTINFKESKRIKENQRESKEIKESQRESKRIKENQRESKISVRVTHFHTFHQTSTLTKKQDWFVTSS